MSAFLIADIDMKDAGTYADYRTANLDIVNEFGGQYVALSSEIKAHEGDQAPRRTVIMKFPNMNAISAFYASPAYAKLRKIRWKISDSKLVAIETLPKPIDRPSLRSMVVAADQQPKSH